MEHQKKGKFQRQEGFPWRRYLPLAAGLVTVLCVLVIVSLLTAPKVNETEEYTTGIDVAKFQGTIDWARVADYGVDFAMVRVGLRGMTDGVITADSNARYNLQEAQKYGIRLGVYFFSTARNEAEAQEEAQWVADFISQYSITYPVAYDCEGYQEPESRQYDMTREERTEVALAFLKAIEKAGYEGMFYGSKHDLETQWDMEAIQKNYKVWVARYPGKADPALDRSGYEGRHQMWQYATDGKIPGISQSVDLNVAYFGYDGVKAPRNKELPQEAFPDVEALLDFEAVEESVTAKDETNLRDIPSQGEDSQVVCKLQNGQIATRIAVSASGWSKVEFNGGIYYAVSSYLTTDLSYTPPPTEPPFDTVFAPMNDQVTAKELVNLRNVPSVTRSDSVIVAQLEHGEVVTRTGINEDVGWSRVEYNGQTLYCVTQYIEPAEE